MRRLMLPLLALAVATAVTLAAGDPSPQPTAKTGDKAAPPSAGKVPKDSCVAECKTCAKECLDCMLYCKSKGHDHHAHMTDACHHACLMCAAAVEGKTPNAWEACELCEKMCNDCAAMCEKGDDRMKKTAEECRKCAKACAEARK